VSGEDNRQYKKKKNQQIPVLPSGYPLKCLLPDEKEGAPSPGQSGVVHNQVTTYPQKIPVLGMSYHGGMLY